MDIPARREFAAPVREYRRGLEYKGGQDEWQKHWHFNDKCENIPPEPSLSGRTGRQTRIFAIGASGPHDWVRR